MSPPLGELVTLWPDSPGKRAERARPRQRSELTRVSAMDAATLELVFAVLLPPSEMGACLGLSPEAASLCWPSTLYVRAALAAVRSPEVFRACARRVDRRADRYPECRRPATAAAAAECFAAAHAAGDGPRMAVVIWCLIVRGGPAETMRERFEAELRTLAARCLDGGRASR